MCFRSTLLRCSVFATMALGARAEPVVFHADWFASPQLAGIFVALDQGCYRDQGLEVTIEPFAFGLDTPARMDASPEVCAVGAIEGYIFLQKRSRGADLKALAAMLQESPAGYLSLDATHIADLRDARGRRVGVHKYAERLFDWFRLRAGLEANDVSVRVVEDDVQLLLEGKIDLLQGYATEEFVRLQELSGRRGRFLSFASLGFPSYSEILYATAAQTRDHPGTLRRFIAATRRGWALALERPELALAAVAAHAPAGAERTYWEASLRALRPYVRPNDAGPLAPMRAEKWRALQEAAQEIGLVDRVEPTERFLLNW